MRAIGKIIKWNDDKGYGFIEPMAGGKEVFAHIKAFPGNSRRPGIGSEVSYEVSSDGQGRPRAVAVQLVGETPSLGPAARAFALAAIFLLIVAVMTVFAMLPVLVLWIYLGMSAVSFGLYAIDKNAARKGDQRTPEKTLHWLALLGGWPGAMYAQQLFRHKSSKASFRIVFWVTLMLNVSALGFLVSPEGAGLREVLGKLH